LPLAPATSGARINVNPGPGTAGLQWDNGDNRPDPEALGSADADHGATEAAADGDVHVADRKAADHAHPAADAVGHRHAGAVVRCGDPDPGAVGVAGVYRGRIRLVGRVDRRRRCLELDVLLDLDR